MRKYTQEELDKVLENHAKWSVNMMDGQRADFRGDDLQGLNFSGKNLRHAHFILSNLKNANFEHADLTGSDMEGSNLEGANCQGTVFKRACLKSANLTNANLEGAQLTDAIVHSVLTKGTNFTGIILPVTIPEGTITGWKKCSQRVIVQLSIPAEARRSCATSNKCRAEFVDVIAVHSDVFEYGISMYDGTTKYRAGRRVTCNYWEEDRWVECGGGIHFFLTREEAEAYEY